MGDERVAGGDERAGWGKF